MCINLRSICTCSFGVPQLQKRIVHGNVILHDDSQLDSVRDVQLVVLPPSCNTSELDAARFIGAVYHNDVWCMSGFLQRGHDPNRAATFRNERLTPIHAAVKAGHQQMVTMLLEAGARDVDHRALDAAATAATWAYCACCWRLVVMRAVLFKSPVGLAGWRLCAGGLKGLLPSTYLLMFIVKP